jgi:hypothetical protein
MAIQCNPKFRFDYYLRSLPIDAIGRRREQLMRLVLTDVTTSARTLGSLWYFYLLYYSCQHDIQIYERLHLDGGSGAASTAKKRRNSGG